MTRFAAAEVAIAAPVEVVWRVMLDLGAYDQWNPFIYRVVRRGGPQPGVGDDIALYVRFRGGRRVVSNERITMIDNPSEQGKLVRAKLEYEFRGPLHNLGMIRGRRLQVIEQGPGESTMYRTEERFRGWLSFAAPTGAVQDGFTRHADALKQRAEALAA